METEGSAPAQGGGLRRRCGWLCQFKVLVPVFAILGLAVAYFPYDAYFQKDDGLHKFITDHQGFQRVGIRNSSHVLVSAYYERRYKRPLVHILGFKKRSDQSRLYCKFIYSEYEIRCSSRPAEARMVDTRQMGDFLAEYFFTCALPPLGRNVPLGVTLTTKPYPCTLATSHVILVHDPQGGDHLGSDEPKGIGVCISTPGYDLRNLDHAQKIVESVVLNKAMGADYVEFHNESMSQDLEPVLKKFIDEGTLRIVKWNTRTKSVRNYAQALAMNDCLYRNMYRYKYLVFTDLDELLLPAFVQGESTKSRWQHMFEYLERRDHSTSPIGKFIFPTTEFYEDKDLISLTDKRFSKYLTCELRETPDLDAATLPMAISHRVRAKEVDMVDSGTRFAVNPRGVGSVTVTEAGHLLKDFETVTSLRREATVRHFRKADSVLDEFDLVQDATLDVFLPKLITALQETVEFPKDCKAATKSSLPYKRPMQLRHWAASKFNKTLQYGNGSQVNQTYSKQDWQASQDQVNLVKSGPDTQINQSWQSGQDSQGNQQVQSGPDTQINPSWQSGQDSQGNQQVQLGPDTQINPSWQSGQNSQGNQQVQSGPDTQINPSWQSGQDSQGNQQVQSGPDTQINQSWQSGQNSQGNQQVQSGPDTQINPSWQSGQDSQGNQQVQSGPDTQINQSWQSGQDSQGNQQVQSGSDTQINQSWQSGQDSQDNNPIEMRPNTEGNQPLQDTQVNNPLETGPKVEVNQPFQSGQDTQVINQPIQTDPNTQSQENQRVQYGQGGSR